MYNYAKAHQCDYTGRPASATDAHAKKKTVHDSIPSVPFSLSPTANIESEKLRA
jgi:hypothetical protein